MLQIVRGNTKTISISVKNADGTPYEMSSTDKAIFAIKKYDDIGLPAVVKKVATAADVQDGKIKIKLRPEDTINLDAGLYHYDFAIKTGSDFFTAKAYDDVEIVAAIATKEDA